MVSPAQSEMKNDLKTNYRPKMLFQFSSLKSSTVDSKCLDHFHNENMQINYTLM